MKSEILLKNLKYPKSRIKIIQELCYEKKVLDIGCVHHELNNSTSTEWLHSNIAKVAKSILGTDYLEAEIDALSRNGYNVCVGDVNVPLPIEEKFDVIVVGNLIEHLSCFSGLMENINRLLVEDGIALISTANPFFREQYFYSALKNDIIVNPEHTCWIDPVTLDQLCRRFSLETIEVLWVKEKWKLSDAYFNGNEQSLSTFNGLWSFHTSPSLLEKIVTPFLNFIYELFIPKEKRVFIEMRYHNARERFIYLKFKGFLLEVWWRCRRLIIPTSDINKHELYVSVLSRKKS